MDRAARPAEEWRDFLERVSKEHEGDDVTIEVLSSDFGDQEQVERLPLAYVEYDTKDDVVIVAVGGQDARYPVVLRHIIERPRSILADPLTPERARALDVEDRDGAHTIVTLHPRSDRPRRS